jgi:hypothetical protein
LASLGPQRAKKGFSGDSFDKAGMVVTSGNTGGSASTGVDYDDGSPKPRKVKSSGQAGWTAAYYQTIPQLVTANRHACWPRGARNLKYRIPIKRTKLTLFAKTMTKSDFRKP